ncbi:MAG TPA: NusG domain II-containing protein [Firmicutes bacterium]|nr:NusG domain II-containing protein [Bacillota bacterium]
MFKLRKGDRLVIGLVLLVSAFLLISLGGRRKTSYHGLILKVKTADGEQGPYYLASFKEPTKLQFKGPVGTSVLEVSASGVRMLQSDCPDKVCIHMGTISKPGEMIICLPNMVFARLVENE